MRQVWHGFSLRRKTILRPLYHPDLGICFAHPGCRGSELLVHGLLKRGALAGQPMNEADPHPTPHKTQLDIYLRKSTQNIIEANDGIGDPKYDFLCGHSLGSYLEARPPYLEFDDRSPDKYLFVSSRGQDDPPIDLNSLRF